jgi:hypothetical protein
MPTCLFHVEFPLSPGTLPLYTSAKTLRCKYSVPNKECTGHVRMYLGGEGTDTTRHAHVNVSLIDMFPNVCSWTMRPLYDKSL